MMQKAEGRRSSSIIFSIRRFASSQDQVYLRVFSLLVPLIHGTTCSPLPSLTRFLSLRSENDLTGNRRCLPHSRRAAFSGSMPDSPFLLPCYYSFTSSCLSSDLSFPRLSPPVRLSPQFCRHKVSLFSACLTAVSSPLLSGSGFAGITSETDSHGTQWRIPPVEEKVSSTSRICLLSIWHYIRNVIAGSGRGRRRRRRKTFQDARSLHKFAPSFQVSKGIFSSPFAARRQIPFLTLCERLRNV